MDSALNVASAALRLLRSLEDLPGELSALKITAAIHQSRGDTEPSLRLLQEVISLSKDSGDVVDQVEALIGCARLRVQRSEGAEALAAAQEAVKLAPEGLAQAKAQLALARVLEAKGDQEQALVEARKAAPQLRLVALRLAWRCQPAAQAAQEAEAYKGEKALVAEAKLVASELRVELGEADRAVLMANEAFELFRERLGRGETTGLITWRMGNIGLRHGF